MISREVVEIQVQNTKLDLFYMESLCFFRIFFSYMCFFFLVCVFSGMCCFYDKINCVNCDSDFVEKKIENTGAVEANFTQPHRKCSFFYFNIGIEYLKMLWSETKRKFMWVRVLVHRFFPIKIVFSFRLSLSGWCYCCVLLTATKRIHNGKRSMASIVCVSELVYFSCWVCTQNTEV